MIEKISEVRKFLVVLTWKKILQLIAFILIIVFSLFIYQFKESVFNEAKDRILNRTSYTQTLSKRTIAEIDNAVMKSDLVAGVQITIVDFQKNIGIVLYSSFDNNELKSVYLNYRNTHLNEMPLFTADVLNNRRLANMINGDFVCNPFLETPEFKLIPEAGKYVNTVCANGIPPYYGKFLGIVTVYVRRTPTIDEVDQIRTMTKGLSSTIYDREFK